MFEVGGMNGTITDVSGLRVGHFTNEEAATGCTVVLCPPAGAVGGVDVRGAAPGTRETDLLRPGNLVERVNAVLLSGGSAFGLDAATGVVRYLEERGLGYDTRVARVPIVPAAILFDLGLGRSDVRPDAEAGYRACLAAGDGPVVQGSVGAGTGATVAKTLGRESALKGGIGSASLRTGDGYTVGALFAVNASGDVVDPETGETVAGPRRQEGHGFHNSLEILQARSSQPPVLATNTTIGVVATDAPLTKEQANRLALMASSGMARALRPAHSMGDGDVVFALSVGLEPGPVNLTALGALAARATELAILQAVREAKGLAGVPSAWEWTHDGH